MSRPADCNRFTYRAIVGIFARMILRKSGSRGVYKPSREELRRRSGQHHIDQAKTRILQRVAKGLPITVLERRLITGDLPPGL